jgi:hypothetical protein
MDLEAFKADDMTTSAVIRKLEIITTSDAWDDRNIIVKSERKRRQNERKIGAWDELPDDRRRYLYEVQGRHGWCARYVKEVDASERTVKFYQESYVTSQKVRVISRESLLFCYAGQGEPLNAGIQPFHIKPNQSTI